ncbi:MAG: hypothetical protein EZS28_032395 [Streblomastix strix]|uniref:Uncharacterized protein n=1 Tax=Streblomastix strix TaxID=222440 RepID=A0A5J4UNS6_9EUKA|nr:MAG: hypothetical protein EZS28_032395 [Streblomastix strix]
MFDSNWYNTGYIVPDQVTPANDATPLSDGTATAGISTEYSRGDHVHPLNITSTIPISDSASGSVGTANYYARNDHSHPLNITTTIPSQYSASETNASNIPIVNGVGANEISAFYARQDHVHPQQLTYDGNVTATKFIKTGGTSNDILLADGSTKQSSLAALNSSTDNSIKFEVSTRTGFGYIQFNQHWSNGSGLIIAADGSTLSFNGKVNTNIIQVNPTLNGTFNEGSTGNNGANPLGFIVVVAGQEGQNDRGLQISADGNTLTFNGRTL